MKRKFKGCILWQDDSCRTHYMHGDGEKCIYDMLKKVLHGRKTKHLTLYVDVGKET